METEVWKYLLTQGPFAALFIWSYYTWRKEAREREKESQERESKLQDLLFQFSAKYDVIVSKLHDIEGKLGK